MFSGIGVWRFRSLGFTGLGLRGLGFRGSGLKRVAFLRSLRNRLCTGSLVPQQGMLFIISKCHLVWNLLRLVRGHYKYKFRVFWGYIGVKGNEL